MTNLVAFLLGAITPIPAIRNFSIQVAMTVICNYIVALFVYPCLLYLVGPARYESTRHRIPFNSMHKGSTCDG